MTTNLVTDAPIDISYFTINKVSSQKMDNLFSYELSMLSVVLSSKTIVGLQIFVIACNDLLQTKLVLYSWIQFTAVVSSLQQLEAVCSS